ncbi:MAG: hypothetical protein L6Q31_01215 [Fimbriimonadaceae bacterium]|nr:hypothetical protein [Fimbriimonadaceae bacterium]
MIYNLIGVLVGVTAQKVTDWAVPHLRDMASELKDTPVPLPVGPSPSQIVHPYSGEPILRHAHVEILIARRQSSDECTVIVLYRHQEVRQAFRSFASADRFARSHERTYGVRRRLV